MRILITGPFGNVGLATVDEALRRGHEVEVFGRHSKRMHAAVRRYAGKLSAVHFGDIRSSDGLETMVARVDAVIHLAGLIPPETELNPELCRTTNVTGSGNMISAIKACPRRPAFVYVSSVSVMGPTQPLGRLVRVDDPVNPTDNYSRSKVESERLTRTSLENYCIVRLAAVIPAVMNIRFQLRELSLLFELPLRARCEIIIDRDVATGLLNACDDLLSQGTTRGKTLILGGGRVNRCQVTTEELIGGLLSAVSLPMLKASLFNPDVNSYYLDWYDTEESERLLRFQNHSFTQIKAAIAKRFATLKPFIRVLSPIIMHWLGKKSPQYQKDHRK